MHRSFKLGLAAVSGLAALAIGGTALASTLTADDPGTPTSSSLSPKEESFVNAQFVPTSDSNGTTVGYVSGPANPDNGAVPGINGVQYVYKNSDGSGGVVGYVTDFGFVDKATFEAPGFNLDEARAAARAQIEANARKVDPNFNLNQLEQNLRDRATNPDIMVPTTTTGG
jgi:hypothetical protein